MLPKSHETQQKDRENIFDIPLLTVLIVILRIPSYPRPKSGHLKSSFYVSYKCMH